MELNYQTPQGRTNLMIAVLAVVIVLVAARWARKNCHAGPFNPDSCKEKYAGRYGCSVGADAHPAARAEDAALRHLGAVRD